jgi:hypothetical protein
MPGSDFGDMHQTAALGPVVQPTELNEGEVWVEYHPASGKRPEILRPMDTLPHGPPTSLPAELSDDRLPPWYPFKSRADFEQAELFLRFDVSDPQIDAQLKLMVTDCPLGHSVTLQSAKEFHATLAQIPTLESMPDVSLLYIYILAHVLILCKKFRTSSFEVPFRHKALRQYDVRYRLILPLVVDLFEDNLVSDMLKLYPERRYIQRPGGGLMRMWEENSCGDDWWIIQVGGALFV